MDNKKEYFRKRIEHPILAYLERPSSDLSSFIERYQEILHSGDYESAKNYAKRNLGFFADEIEGIGPCTLNEVSIVALWKRMELDLGLSFYAIRIIETAYASLVLPEDRRRGFTRQVYENRKFPEEFLLERKLVELYYDKIKFCLGLAHQMRNGSRKFEQMLSIEQASEFLNQYPTYFYSVGDMYANGVLMQYLELGDHLFHQSSLK